MRIVWNDQDNWFQAEISQSNFSDDIDSVKDAGFRTSGPPSWTWHTSKASNLSKLRDLNPKSGLTITEAALDKYKFLNEQEQRKKELKKKFQQAKKKSEQEINSANWKDYIDPETGIVCKIVLASVSDFRPTYVRPPAPENYCFICGDPIYWYEAGDICIWCEK